MRAAISDEFIRLSDAATKNFSSFLFHSHSNFELLYFRSGEIEYYIEENAYRLAPGDLLIIPPGKLHRAVVKDQTALYHRSGLDIQVETANELMRRHPDSFVYQLQQAHCISMKGDNKEQYEQIIAQLFSLQAGETLARDCLVTLLFLVIDCALAEQKTKIPPSPPMRRIQSVIEYINKNLSKDLSLDVLAREFYISKYHLSHQFKSYTKQTIHTYIKEKRMLSAAAQLQDGIQPQQVAENLGFSTYAGFHRAFVQKYGVAPSAYCRERQALL